MFGWSVLYPAFLVGAAAAAVPIALHLMSRRAAPIVPFSATRFLSSAPVESGRWRRLREYLLLALRVGALLLLALSFARPYTDWGVLGATAPATIIALDTSLSVGGTDRFERARHLALEAVDAVPTDHLVGIVTFADEAAVAAAPASDRERAREAIRAARAGYGATSYAGAIAGAVSALGPRPGRIVVVTDLQRGGWEAPGTPSLPRGTTVEVIDIGPVAANLAVTDVRVNDGRLTTTVTGYGQTAASSTVTLEIDGAIVERVSADVTVDGSAEITFAKQMPTTGEMRVSVDDGNGLPADDERFLVLDRPDAARVLVIGEGGQRSGAAFFVERALRSRNEAHALDVRVEGAWTDRDDVDTPTRPDVVVFLAGEATGPSGRGLRQHVERGGGLLLIAGPTLAPQVFEEVPGVAVAGGAGRTRSSPGTTFAPADARHPVFRPFGAMTPALGRVRFDRHLVLTPSDRAAVLARFSDGDPALVEFAVGKGRVLVFASDLSGAWNDFPLQPVFVPFVHELVRYLAPTITQPSAYLVGEVPQDIEATPGIVSDPVTGRRVAVNVDPRESMVSRLTIDEFTAPIASSSRAMAGPVEVGAAGREAEQQYWQYALLFMLVVVATEGLVGRRAT